MITIKGIKITQISMTENKDEDEKLTGAYDLVSDKDKILAHQSFNGYNTIKLEQTTETKKLRIQFMESVQRDLELQLGLINE